MGIEPLITGHPAADPYWRAELSFHNGRWHCGVVGTTAQIEAAKVWCADQNYKLEIRELFASLPCDCERGDKTKMNCWSCTKTVGPEDVARFRVVKMPVYDTGIGQEAGFEDDADLARHVEAVRAKLPPAVRAMLASVEAAEDRLFLEGKR
jgi:hypothetical protein